MNNKETASNFDNKIEKSSEVENLFSLEVLYRRQILFIYNICRFSGLSDLRLDDIIREIARSLPGAMMFPDFTAVRITIFNKSYGTDNYRDTPWKTTLDVAFGGDKLGTMEVCRLENKKGDKNEIFFREEMDFLEHVAIHLGSIINGFKNYEKKRIAGEFLENILNGLDDPIFVKDEEHRWVVINDRFCEMVGHSREELLGKSDYDFFPENQAIVFWEKDQLVFDTGETNINEEEINWANELRIISTKKSRFTDSVTGEKFLAGNIRDITQRIEMDKALKDKEKKYRKLFENSNDAIFIYNSRGEILEVNPRACRMLDYTSEQLLSRNVMDLQPVEFRNGDETFNVVDKSGAITYQTRFQKAGGEIIYVEISSGVIDREKGLIQGIARDITRRIQYEEALQKARDQLEERVKERTAELERINRELRNEIQERKKAEEQVRESKEKYRLLFATSPESISILDLDGNFVECNKATEKIAGMPREDLIGKSLLELSLLEDEDLSMCKNLISLMLNGESVEPVEISLHYQDGRELWVEIHPSLIKEKGEVTSIQVITRDVTERKHMEQEMISRNRELNDFASRVSHDLKSPINLLAGYCSAIQEAPELFDEYFGRVMNLSEKMVSFVDRMLALSRAGRVIQEKRNIHLAPLVDRVVSSIDTNGESYEITVVPPDAEIYGDGKTLEQVFSNLIQNSMHFIDPLKEKLRIEIKVRKNDKHTLITFEDNGLGIKKEDLANIFGAGYSTRKNGNGFGLAIIKKIIQAHGGSIEAHSRGENKGARFEIKMPIG